MTSEVMDGRTRCGKPCVVKNHTHEQEGFAMHDITQHYLATWNSVGAERTDLLEEHWSPRVSYVDPMASVTGHEGMNALIDGVHQQFPGLVFSLASDVDSHHQQLRFSWGLGPADEEPIVLGFDVVVLDDDGRIEDVRGFLDKVPA